MTLFLLLLGAVALAEPEVSPRIESPPVLVPTEIPPPVSASAELIEAGEAGVAQMRPGVGPDLTPVAAEPELEGLMAVVSPFVELFAALDPYHDEAAWSVVLLGAARVGYGFHTMVGARISGWAWGQLGGLLLRLWQVLVPVLPAVLVGWMRQGSAAVAKRRLLGGTPEPITDEVRVAMLELVRAENAAANQLHVTQLQQQAHYIELLEKALGERAAAAARVKAARLARQTAGPVVKPDLTRLKQQISPASPLRAVGGQG